MNGLMNNSTIHWLDLDGTLWVTDAKWWVVDKRKPDRPLLKISQEEGSLSVSGHYKSLGHKIEYNGINAWLNPVTAAKLAEKNIPLEQVGISYREFNDKMYLDMQAENMVVMVERIKHLDESDDTVALLTARGNKANHHSLVEALKRKISEHGLKMKIDKLYFVTDTALARHGGHSHYRKAVIIIEHAVGFRVKDDAFVSIEQEKYDETHFYDDEEANILAVQSANEYIRKFLGNTDEDLAKEIREDLAKRSLRIHTHKVSTNVLNPFESTTVVIDTTEKLGTS